MAYFLRSGTNWRVTSKESMDLHELLPAGNYTVGQDPYGNFFLEQIEDFELPEKLYGKTTRHTDRIINSFWKRPTQTGVLLNGEKGSGKTLLAKNISTELAKQGVPTIVINKAWTDEGFFKLLQDIDQPCIIMFDEFEKVYDRDDQERILTLLDGVFASKKLYILTVNDKWRIDSHMRNRPGRIFYLIDFKGLEASFIREYAEDKLENKSYIDQLCNIAALYSEFNFDMLKALVEEMNRYNESPSDALELLNIKIENDNGSKYKLSLVTNGKSVSDDELEDKEWKGNPLVGEGIRTSFYDNKKDNWRYFHFTPDSLIKMDNQKGEFIFENKGSRLILTRIVEPAGFNYSLVL
jgi:DNA polymerase III delta prime subunit